MIKNQTDAITERSRRKAGVYYSHARGSKKNYVVNVPDYDNDRPDRIVPLIKMTSAKEAQDYYEAWTTEHKRQYEERLGGNTETEQAKIRAEEDAGRIKREQELRYKFNEAQRRVQAKDDEIQSLNAIAGQSEKAYAREKDKRERLQAELETVRKELLDMKEQASVKEQEKMKREALSRKKEIERLRRELEIARGELKRMESGELREQIAAKERTVAMLQDRLANLNDELKSERGRHAGEVRCLEQQKTMLEQALEDSPVSKYRMLKLISIFAVITVALFIMGSVIVSVSRQKHLNDVTNVIGGEDTETSQVAVTDSLDVADLSVGVVADSSRQFAPTLSGARDMVVDAEVKTGHATSAQVLAEMSEHLKTVTPRLVNFCGIVLLFFAVVLLLYASILRSSGREERLGNVMTYVRLCLMGGLLLCGIKALFLRL